MSRRGLAIVIVCLVAAGCGGATKHRASRPAAARSAGIAALVPATPAVLAEGRRLFQANARPAGCAFCHSLRAAASTSPLGPSLNAEMSEPDIRHLTDAQLAQQVRRWIHDAPCMSPTDVMRCMPSDSYTGLAADKLAVFVATCGRKPQHRGCEPVSGGYRGQALEGKRLFQTRGCVGCHFSLVGPSAGPSLYGLAGSDVTLADGATVTADDAYLTGSIAAPDAKIVNGYQAGLMSSRVSPQHLTRAQIDALVAYVKTLK